MQTCTSCPRCTASKRSPSQNQGQISSLKAGWQVLGANSVESLGQGKDSEELAYRSWASVEEAPVGLREVEDEIPELRMGQD